VVEDQTEVITRYRQDGTVTFVNEVYCRFFGKTFNELVGTDWHPNAYQEDLPLIEARLKEMSPANPIIVIENRVHVASGEIRWMQFVNRGFYDDQGQLIETQAVGRDITERKHAEIALRETETRFSTIFRNNPIANGISRMDNGHFVDVNDAFLDMFGFSRDEIIGHSSLELAMWPRPEDRDQMIRQIKEHGRVQQLESEFRHKSGRIGYLLISAEIIDLHGQKYLMGMLTDITERKRIEAHLVELNEKLRNLSEHLQTVQEQERLSIARDIHDEIGQQLTALKLDISWVENRLEEAGGELAERLEGMDSSIDLLITRVQQIAADLRPPLLDNLGLAAAIGWQVSEFTRRSGIECILMLNENAGPADLQTATSIVRIVQEALTNVIRHAGATEVAISLCKTNGGLLLEISDNGRGVSEKEIAAKDSYGLIGMQERARLCGGEMVINGSPGAGTRLRLTIPHAEGTTGL